MRFILFCFFSIPLILFAQQSKTIFFDQNWQLSTSKYNQFYVCQCYTLPSGAFDGPFTCFLNDSDTLVKKYHFKNNVLDGEVFEYYADGTLKLQAFYKDGVAINTWKEWNAKGELVVDKFFDETGRITKDNTEEELSEYEKMYFGIKKFEEPVFKADCIIKRITDHRIECSQAALEQYYKTPPLPPSYFKDAHAGNTYFVDLKYLLSKEGKVLEVEIVNTSGDSFLDELAEIHILNMMPFEAAKEYGAPIEHWLEAKIEFNFSE